VTHVASANEEALAAWNGVLFDRFVAFRHLLVDGLSHHGEEAIAIAAPAAGDRILDVGCGFGDMTRRLAELAGPTGSALGVDVAPRFVEAARAETADARVRYDVRDVQVTEFAESFDFAFSRFGTMFFANPVPALRNVRRALRPGGRLCMVVWRRKLDNPWTHRAEGVVKPLLPESVHTDEPRCGPGPFSMADADTTTQILLGAGFAGIALHRVDLPLRLGADLDEAIAFNMALGPAAEAIRLAGEDAERIRPELASLLRDALAGFETGDGVVADSSTWVVTARA
jgi:SAM-dependent methyltransferase